MNRVVVITRASAGVGRKFAASVGRAIGARAVIEGFFRVSATLRLITSRRSI